MRSKEAGHRVSIDSHDIGEMAAAVGAGAELVLSVSRNQLQGGARLGM